MGLDILVVDDSATARAVMTQILEKAPNVTSVRTAADAFIARDMMVKKRPDVICLDVEMPRMDGISFLKRIMKHMPTPVIMVSSLTTKGAKTTLDALEAGALDFVAKPHSNIYDGKNQIEEEILAKIEVASTSKVKVKKQATQNAKVLNYTPTSITTTQKIIAVGSSTGGTEALKEFLIRLPANSPSVIVTQHMPANFTKQFASRLNDLCNVSVKEAENRDSLGVGQVFIAPGDKHMVLRRSGARYYVEIGTGQKVSGHRPSVDVLFNSVSKAAGANAIGVILTGMGSDGAKGLLNMRKAGSITFGQDERSCVVYGMPKAANELGAVGKEVHIEKMTETVLKSLEKMTE